MGKENILYIVKSHVRKGVQMTKNIRVNVANGIAIMSIDGLKDLNLFNWDILDELYDILCKVEEGKDVKIIVITGSGEKAFSAGADLHEELKLDVLAGERWSQLGQKIANKIESLSMPVIGAVNGYALGGGMEIAIACDILIASENAVFGLPEVKYGIIPGWGGTQRLTKLIGKGKAMEMILTGETIDANEARKIGIVSRVVKQKDLVEEEAVKMAQKIIDNGPVAIRYAKKLINMAVYEDVEKGCELESSYFAMCFSTEDQKEGMISFIEKRKPYFKGK